MLFNVLYTILPLLIRQYLHFVPFTIFTLSRNIWKKRFWGQLYGSFQSFVYVLQNIEKLSKSLSLDCFLLNVLTTILLILFSH